MRKKKTFEEIYFKKPLSCIMIAWGTRNLPINGTSWGRLWHWKWNRKYYKIKLKGNQRLWEDQGFNMLVVYLVSVLTFSSELVERDIPLIRILQRKNHCWSLIYSRRFSAKKFSYLLFDDLLHTLLKRKDDKYRNLLMVSFFEIWVFIKTV